LLNKYVEDSKRNGFVQDVKNSTMLDDGLHAGGYLLGVLGDEFGGYMNENNPGFMANYREGVEYVGGKYSEFDNYMGAGGSLFGLQYAPLEDGPLVGTASMFYNIATDYVGPGVGWALDQVFTPEEQTTLGVISGGAGLLGGVKYGKSLLFDGGEVLSYVN